MGYAREAMNELHGTTAFTDDESAGVPVDYQREMERRGSEISNAMGRYRGTEPLVDAVARLANDYHNATTLGYVLRHVEVELQRARETHPPMNSHHEGYAVILEELDELWEVCKQNTHKFGSELAVRKEQREQKRAAMRKEALQVAAMAIRFIEDICDKS